MLDIIKVIVLSIVEGITEFLPVSSTGHMILVNDFVNLNPKEFSNAFMVIIQLGAILAIVAIYFEKLNPFSKKKLDGKDFPPKIREARVNRVWINKIYYFLTHNKTMSLWYKIIVSCLPAAVLGILFDDKIDELLFSPLPVALALVFYGIIIVFMEKRNEKKEKFKITDVFKISYKEAFIIGCFQVLAMWPGTSRSAATIIGAMIIGLNRKAAADFSFFLAIPTMFGASLLKILKTPSMTGSQWGLITLGFILSFIVAYVVIKKFLDYIKANDFKIFGYYRIILGLIVILYSIF